MPPSASEILRCAFAKRFDREITQVIDVETTKDGRIIRAFRLQMASKPIDGGFRSLVYFLAPYDERGTRVLSIENDARRDEHFVFLPFLGKIKRVYGGRRSESFMGTDFNFEDMERSRIEEFDIHYAGVEDFEGEPTYVISAHPKYDSAYAHSEYRIAAADCTIVEMRHFKSGSDGPSKIISIPRSAMKRVDGELMPTLAVAEDIESGRSTVLRFSKTRLNPGVDSRYFNPSALLKMTGIPGIPKASSSD